MADFSSQSQLKYEFNIDDELGLTTITVKDSGDAVIDTIIIESNRCRSFLESLAMLAKEFFPDTNTALQGAKTVLNKNASTASLVFG